MEDHAVKYPSGDFEPSGCTGPYCRWCGSPFVLFRAGNEETFECDEHRYLGLQSSK